MNEMTDRERFARLEESYVRTIERDGERMDKLNEQMDFLRDRLTTALNERDEARADNRSWEHRWENRFQNVARQEAEGGEQT